MLRELSVTLTGRPSDPSSLTQPPTSSESGADSPDQEGDDEEVTFDVKVEQGGFTGKSDSSVCALV